MKNVTDKFIRWQSTTISQLSYSINLFLSFSIAVLGFSITMLSKDNFNLVNCQKFWFSLSLIFTFVSIIFGVVCTLNRLNDFRSTAQIAKLDQKNKLSDIRGEISKKGDLTWKLFYLQISTFSLGIFSMCISLFLVFSSKLL